MNVGSLSRILVGIVIRRKNFSTIVFSSILLGNEIFFNKRYIGTDISSPPFEKVAELYGAKGFRVDKISEISEAIRAALDCNKPTVVNVSVDPDAIYSFRHDSFKHRLNT